MPRKRASARISQSIQGAGLLKLYFRHGNVVQAVLHSNLTLPSGNTQVGERADASTLNVVDAVKTALPRMQAMLPAGIHLSFEFDQSVCVTSAIRDLLIEGAAGAVLTGLMVLLFLADWRSASIVIVTIPLSIMAAFIALRFAGESVNIMTLGGLAPAVGILVDEATVAMIIYSDFDGSSSEFTYW